MAKEKETSLESIIRRLESLESERAIMQTLYSYGQYIDYGLKEEWVNLFTVDGAYDHRPTEGLIIDPSLKARAARRYEGRAALREFIASHSNAPIKYHKHLLVEPVVSFKNNVEATVKSYWVRVDKTDEGAIVYAFGQYNDRMVKQDDAWFIKERIVLTEALQTQKK